jgi:molybdate transport system substrate-binding protein
MQLIGVPIALAITVFAAADLGPAFKQLVPAFERQTGTRVTLVLGSTGLLTQQIRNGAPADVFFAANATYVDQLSAESLARNGSRTRYARGRIALVSLKASGVGIADLKALAAPAIRRVAIANPLHAPYGVAARQALEAAGVWNAVQPKLVYGENVQQAVQFVRSGSADAGIVALSVANTPDLQRTVIDRELHEPLDQVAVVLARTKHAEAAQSFIDFVNGSAGRAVLRQFGFE